MTGGRVNRGAHGQLEQSALRDDARECRRRRPRPHRGAGAGGGRHSRTACHRPVGGRAGLDRTDGLCRRRPGVLLLGASRAPSVGADSTTAPIFAGSLALLAAAGSAHYLMLCAGLALMVGLIVGAGGLLRMGWIARLLSQPVITGFLAGIAVHIVLSQAPIFLGMTAPNGGPADDLRTILTSRPNPYAAAIGLFVFAATLACEKFDRRISGALLATLITAAAAALFGLAGRGVVMLDASQSRLPGLALPMLSGKEFIQLAPVALIISLVVMIQSAATSRSFDEQGEGDGINRDFIGVGLGNLLSGLAGGFPANASPPRTAIVCESGGRSRLCGLCAAVLVAFFLAFGLSLLRFLPQAALAGPVVLCGQANLPAGGHAAGGPAEPGRVLSAGGDGVGDRGCFPSPPASASASAYHCCMAYGPSPRPA